MTDIKRCYLKTVIRHQKGWLTINLRDAAPPLWLCCHSLLSMSDTSKFHHTPLGQGAAVTGWSYTLKLRGWGGGCFCGGERSRRGHNSFLDKCFSPAVRSLSSCLSKVLAGRHGHGRLQRGSGPSLHHAGVRKHAGAAAGHR